jgi:hypothetical protein
VRAVIDIIEVVTAGEFIENRMRESAAVAAAAEVEKEIELSTLVFDLEPNLHEL